MTRPSHDFVRPARENRFFSGDSVEVCAGALRGVRATVAWQRDDGKYVLTSDECSPGIYIVVDCEMIDGVK